MKRLAALLAILAATSVGPVSAADPVAIGCTLSNPAEDLKYLFPEITSYREDAKDLGRLKDGQALYKKLHGVNVPGKGGVIQVFLTTDPKTAEIRTLFFQRLESAAAAELRAKPFRAQFQGLTLADFYKHDYYAVAEPASDKDKLAAIKDPTTDPAAKPDYLATLRGVRKNLILLDIFVYDLRAEPFYERAREALKKLEKKN
jgi:hypothetical protein